MGIEHPELTQREYEVRCEWGQCGLAAIAPGCDAIVIIDVFSFTTSVDIAVSRGASIHPYRFRDESAVAFAESVGALLAGQNERGYTLRPHSLVDIEPGTRLVLPSPNGSTLSQLAAGDGGLPTFAACLRNASAVAAAAARCGPRVAVIPAGELWPNDGSLQPALEDQCGAGAVIAQLPGRRSPEAEAAVAVFRDALHELFARMRGCASGVWKQLRALDRDIELAAQHDVSDAAPMLRDGVYGRG